MLLAEVELYLDGQIRYKCCLDLVANQRDRRMDFPNRRKPLTFLVLLGLPPRLHRLDDILGVDFCQDW